MDTYPLKDNNKNTQPNVALIDIGEDCDNASKKRKGPPERVTLFYLEAWRLRGLTPFSQPPAELAPFAADFLIEAGRTLGFVFPELPLLPHG